MKRLVPLLLVGVLLAVMTWSLVRRGCCDSRLACSAACGDVGCWFRCEFGASPEVSAAISREQNAFTAQCEAECAAVRRCEAERAALGAEASPASIAAADAALAAARATSLRSREAFVQRVAALLEPEARVRYLALVTPRLADHTHAGATDATGRR